MSKPTYNVYVVKKGQKQEDKDYWTKVGAAWNHADSEGLNIVLDFPVGVTELTLRVPKQEA